MMQFNPKISSRRPGFYPAHFYGLIPLLFAILFVGVAPGFANAGQRRHRHYYRQPAGRDALNRLQREITAYMRDNSHPASGMAYEASFAFTGAGRPLAVAGTGFGLAALVAGVERGWLDREETAGQVVRIGSFLKDSRIRKTLHGALPRWLYADNGNGNETGSDGPGSDVSADLVETSFLIQGLLIARAYFDADTETERRLRQLVDTLAGEVEWDWFTGGREEGLYWQWNRRDGFDRGAIIPGGNDNLVAYVLALGSPTHPISRANYERWAEDGALREREVAGYRLPEALPGGGPLSICHYAFVGLNPWELADRHVPEGYFTRNLRQVLSNRGYCLYEAPEEFQYGEDFWGLSASLSPDGYVAFSPEDDRGFLAPSAALASIAYVPYYAMQVLANLDGELRRMAWGANGPYDAVSLADNWCANEYLALNQLPIAGMIENYRSGLLWKLFMGAAEVKAGLAKAGLTRPDLREGFPEAVRPLEPAAGGGYAEGAYVAVVHPETNSFLIPYWLKRAGRPEFALYDASGGMIWESTPEAQAGRNWLEILPDDLDAAGLRYGDSDADAGGLVLRLRRDNGDFRLPVELHHMP